MSHCTRLLWLFLMRLLTRVPAICIGVTLVVCLAPGFYSDERALDVRISADTAQRIEQDSRDTGTPLGIAFRYLAGLSRGDFGQSRTFARPVSELLVERAKVTLPSAAAALSLGWAAALLPALWVIAFRAGAVQAAAMSAASVVICVPTVLAGFLTAVWQVPVEAALTAIVFARAYTYSQKILLHAAGEPHVTLARATGSRLHRILFVHVFRNAVPQLLSVMANSVVLVLGAAVPVEVVRDVPGIGQLAWKATMGRDLPVLLAVTLVVSVCSIAAATVSDVSSSGLREVPA